MEVYIDVQYMTLDGVTLFKFLPPRSVFNFHCYNCVAYWILECTQVYNYKGSDANAFLEMLRNTYPDHEHHSHIPLCPCSGDCLPANVIRIAKSPARNLIHMYTFHPFDLVWGIDICHKKALQYAWEIKNPCDTALCELKRLLVKSKL